MDEITIVILCAGKGRRIGRGVPKSLIKIDKDNILEKQLYELKKSGISKKNIHLVTGYKSYMFKKYPFSQFKNRLYFYTNQVFSISRAKKLSNSKRVLILYGDILFSHKELVNFLTLKDDIVVGSYKHWRKLWHDRGDINFTDLESFNIDNENKLIEIGNEIKEIEDVKGQFMGLILFNNYQFEKFVNTYRSLISELGIKKYLKIETTQYLNMLISFGFNIKVFNFLLEFFEFDTEDDINLYKRLNF